MSDQSSRERELAKSRDDKRRQREKTGVRAFERYQWRDGPIRTARAFGLLPELYPWTEADYQSAIDGAFEILDRFERIAPVVAIVLETKGYNTSKLPADPDEDE